jgi:hypothetical protein
MKLNLITAVLLLSLLPFCLNAQHKIPVGTKGNAIELNIKNPPGSASTSFVVTVDEFPEWIEFSSNRIEINKLNVGENAVAIFSFDIKSSALLNEEFSILFQITDERGKSFNKFIDILVTPPDKFDLEQNYPNPFNPSTIIKYQLPVDGRVTIKLFDILGREVMTLLNEDKKAGAYELEFNASYLASGVYIYRMSAGSSGQTGDFSAVKKMILLQ